MGALDVWLAGSARAGAHGARRLTKPTLMPLLATALLTRPGIENSPMRDSTLLAEAAGWVGDMILLNDGTVAFAAGAGAFGIGHGAYIWGLRANRRIERPLKHAPSGRVAMALALGAGPLMAVGAAREDPALSPAVAAYVGLISTMFACAGNLRTDLPTRTRRLTGIGAAAFVASDSLLATRQFWWRGAPARVESVVMITYLLAQLLLSEGAAAATPQRRSASPEFPTFLSRSGAKPSRRSSVTRACTCRFGRTTSWSRIASPSS
jgi:uncharacterized membrane protein YhhN